MVMVAGVVVVVSALASINEVNQRRVRLVLRWVTVSGFNSRCVTFIPVSNQSPRSTQPGHPIVGRRNEYQSKGGDAVRKQLIATGEFETTNFTYIL